MTDVRAFDTAVLLRHLACELGRLADTADAAQHAAAALIHAESPHGAEEFMVGLQAMDALSQVLRDLQRLAGAAAESRVGRSAADPAFIRRSLLLQSLADRLIAGPDHGGGQDPAAFLL